MPKTSSDQITVYDAVWKGNTNIQMANISEAQLRKLSVTALACSGAPINPQIIIQNSARFGVEDASALRELVGDLLPIRPTFILLGYELYSDEAQDSLLKLLEETPNHIKICIVTIPSQSLLPTVQSRLFTISLEHHTGNGVAAAKKAPKGDIAWSVLYQGPTGHGLSPGQIRRLQGVVGAGSKLPQKWVSDWLSLVKSEKKSL